jgi:hypothetical protein
LALFVAPIMMGTSGGNGSAKFLHETDNQTGVLRQNCINVREMHFKGMFIFIFAETQGREITLGLEFANHYL